MSVRFFRHDHSLYMFDPDTFRVYRLERGHWALLEDSALREEIRLRSIEVSCAEALQAACGRAETGLLPGRRCARSGSQPENRVLSLSKSDRSPVTAYLPVK